MRFGWRKPYDSRGSRTVLRGAGVKLPGLLTFKSIKIIDKIKKWLMSKLDIKYFNLEINLN